MGRTHQDTRARLLEAGKRLFAERGFRDVTVREICRAAGANLAAVNYHFQDKEGLYRAVFEHGIAMLQETTGLSLRAAAGASPEDRLRAFIHTVVERMAGRGTDNWFAQLMHRELDNPTRAFDDVVERAIGPRMRALAELSADVMRCDLDDPRVCQAVVSIHALVMLAFRPWHAFGERLRWRQDWTPFERAEHIAAFSVGGLVALRDGRGAAERGTGTARERSAESSPLPTALL